MAASEEQCATDRAALMSGMRVHGPRIAKSCERVVNRERPVPLSSPLSQCIVCVTLFELTSCMIHVSVQLGTLLCAFFVEASLATRGKQQKRPKPAF